MDIDALTHPTDTQTAARALADAAATAGYAPSIRNTQPWRWRLTGSTLDLHLVRSRVLGSSDPDARLATLSCGVALHHARVAMAAQGWQIAVTRMLQGADRDLLARLHVHRRAPADPASATLLRMIPSRHTERRRVAETPVGPAALAAITTAVEAEDTRLHRMLPGQLLELATAAAEVERGPAADTAWQAELTYWTGPAEPARSGNPGDFPITARRDRAATFVVLHGRADEPLDWLRAGEALSAGWLTATAYGVSVLPHSAPIEIGATRQALRAMIAGAGFPYLVLRLGTADPGDADPPRVPLLPAVQIIEHY
ncbi:hypothetical protein [Paractinoplanes globisporus]|uniref:Nitroreductase n=1 Tax=Paractinoplanes globisporus TaxID=113565 RepID=A0ABW6WA55_9ACTN|nr:hypothetical protein [Actinoplanes globisporus]